MSEEIPNINAVDGSANPKKRLDPGAKRNLKILLGVLALSAIGVTYAVLSAINAVKPKPAVPVSTVPVNMNQAQTVNKNLTPQMQQMLVNVQKQDSQSALQTGQSYVPAQTNIGKPIKINVAPEVPSASAPVVQPIHVNTAQSQPGGAAIPQDVLQGLQRQLPAILGAEHADVVTIDFKNGAGQQGSSQVAPSMAVGNRGFVSGFGGIPQAAGRQGARRPVINAYQIYPAVLVSPIDTGKTTYASAKIVAGPLAGAFVVGTAIPHGDAVQMAFDNAALNGQHYTFKSVGLDQITSSNAIDGNVDRHLLSKYVMPVVLAMAGAYATAEAQTGSTLVGLGAAGATAVQQPAPTAQQARAAGLAAAMNSTNQLVQRNAQQPDTITIPEGTPIGILFTSPVYAATSN